LARGDVQSTQIQRRRARSLLLPNPYIAATLAGESGRHSIYTPFQARVIKIPRFQNAPCTHLANGKPSFYQDQCCGSVLVSMRIRDQLLTSVRIQIRIQGAKPMRIHADPYTGQNFTPQKVDFLNEKYTLLYVGNES